jgi:FMN phosphatase YigB (HAD superfamily)
MRLLFLLLLSFSLLEAKIIQTNHIEDILSHLNASTWVLFDLDDTLIEGENQLGSAKWYYHETEKLVQRGLSNEHAQKVFYPQWILSQTICPVRTIEPHTALIVAKAQAMTERAIGLTTRPPPIASLTSEQLQKLGIDLTETALEFPSGFDLEATVYRNGIWFLSDLPSKGKIVLRLLDAMEAHPKRIVYIDDGRHHLEEMEKALSEKKIEFIGIHYKRAQKRPYDSQIADLQYRSLPEILSDAEAALILKVKNT